MRSYRTRLKKIEKEAGTEDIVYRVVYAYRPEDDPKREFIMKVNKNRIRRRF